MRTLISLLQETELQHGSKAALMFKEEGAFRSITYAEYLERVRLLTNGLLALGINPEDKVAVLSENRWEWVVSDFAILALGAVTTPVYPTLPPSQIEYILNHSEARLIFVSDQVQLDKVKSVFNNLKNLRRIVIYSGKHEEEPTHIFGFGELIEFGRKYREEHSDAFDTHVSRIQTDDLATIIYTSGTLGEPKGVMLSHRNFIDNIAASIRIIQIRRDDTLLSHLPLSHVFERMAGHFLSVSVAATIAFAESIEKVAANLTEVKPTVLCTVPRLLEKIQSRVLERVRSAPLHRRLIFRWSLRIGRKAYEKRGKIGGLLKRQYALADKLVFQKLKESLGGRMRFMISGGAPLPISVGAFFLHAGIIIIEGYGLTETSPVIAANPLANPKLGTVGPPLENVEVTIAGDGEILVKGTNVMKEYFKSKTLTEEAIDARGWFHTGDIGFLDEDGYLVITDRKKNILVTSGGKNVAPAYVENTILASRYINQIMVLGDGQRYISALIVPDFDNIRDYADIKHLTSRVTEDLIGLPEIRQLIRNEIDRLSTDFSTHEQIKQFALLESEFTITSGEVTPTLKVKRNVVEKKYALLIEEMYSPDKNREDGS